MNRIYRLIWSKALRCLVAVAENTRGRGKGGCKSEVTGSGISLSADKKTNGQGSKPPHALKPIHSRNFLSALAISASFLGLHSNTAQAECTEDTVPGFIVCTGSTPSYTNSSTLTAIDNYGSITTLSNSGNISGHEFGIYNEPVGSIGTLLNTGAINGDSVGVYNALTIGAFSNIGLISGDNGIVNDDLGSITLLQNFGTIASSSPDNYGIGNIGRIATVSNSGLLLNQVFSRISFFCSRHCLF